MFDRENAIFFRRHRLFARAEHERNARAIDVAITNTDARAGIVQSHREIRRHRRFPHATLAARNGDDVLDSRNPGRADSRTAYASWWRVNVDQDFRVRHAKFSKNIFGLGFDGARDRGVIRSQRHLHARFGIRRNDFLDQTKRNDVPAESGIFHRLQCITDLFLSKRHCHR